MATAREYLDSLADALTRVRALQPSDEDLRPWLDDLQSAEERICMLAGCLEDEMGEAEIPPGDFHVEIHGEYGINDGSIHLMGGDGELVMWDSAEWIEDPSLVFVIANALRKGFEEGPGALRLPHDEKEA